MQDGIGTVCSVYKPFVNNVRWHWNCVTRCPATAVMTAG